MITYNGFFLNLEQKEYFTESFPLPFDGTLLLENFPFSFLPFQVFYTFISIFSSDQLRGNELESKMIKLFKFIHIEIFVAYLLPKL